MEERGEESVEDVTVDSSDGYYNSLVRRQYRSENQEHITGLQGRDPAVVAWADI